MDEADVVNLGPLRFTSKTVLVATAFIAIFLAWYRSSERYQKKLEMWQIRCANANTQLSVEEMRHRADKRAESTRRSRPDGFHAAAQLVGVNMRDVVLKGDSDAFEHAVFDNTDLRNATLGGGRTSFQCASFNNAILRNARVGGGRTSFQLATFENADLSAATLVGDFQCISLKNANCTGATIEGRIQSANIDGARFEDADLSGTNNVHLDGTHYDEPPTYNANTKFPYGFDPVAMGWKKVPVGSKPTD